MRYNESDLTKNDLIETHNVYKERQNNGNLTQYNNE